MTCGVWIGYDEKKTLARRKAERMPPADVDDFMKVALAGKDPGAFQPHPSFRQALPLAWTRPSRARRR